MPSSSALSETGTSGRYIRADADLLVLSALQGCDFKSLAAMTYDSPLEQRLEAAHLQAPTEPCDASRMCHRSTPPEQPLVERALIVVHRRGAFHTRAFRIAKIARKV